MHTRYELVAFSRNVGSISTGFTKHSGYALVRYENNVAVAMIK